MIRISYHLKPSGQLPGDAFAIQVVDEKSELSIAEKMLLLDMAIAETLERFPMFVLQYPDYVNPFIQETKGDGTVWLIRKFPQAFTE